MSSNLSSIKLSSSKPSLAKPPSSKPLSQKEASVRPNQKEAAEDQPEEQILQESPKLHPAGFDRMRNARRIPEKEFSRLSLMQAETYLCNRSRDYSRISALLAASDANREEREYPLTHAKPPNLKTFKQSRSAIVKQHGVKGLAETIVDVDDEDAGDYSSSGPGGNVHTSIIEPHMAIDLASFLSSFLCYTSAQPEPYPFSFDESGIHAMAILLDELIADMARTWKNTGAPLGDAVTAEQLRRVAIAQINQAGLDFAALGVDQATSLLSNRVDALVTSPDSQRLPEPSDIVRDVVEQYLQMSVFEKPPEIGKMAWKDYGLPHNRDKYVAIFHKDVFLVGPIVQIKGAGIRIGQGTKMGHGLMSLNKVLFKTYPFPKPERTLLMTAREVAMKHVRALYVHLTTLGWEHPNGTLVPPMTIPRESIDTFVLIFGRPEFRPKRTKASTAAAGTDSDSGSDYAEGAI